MSLFRKKTIIYAEGPEVAEMAVDALKKIHSTCEKAFNEAVQPKAKIKDLIKRLGEIEEIIDATVHLIKRENKNKEN